MPDGSDMLTRLRSERDRAVASAPPDTRVYVIGDVHGRADLLAALHARIAEDIRVHAGRRSVLVYLGDYVDRGAHSRQTLDRLLDHSLGADRTVFLAGNHEQAMLDFMADPHDALHWLTYGGVETLASYGVEIEGHLRVGLGLQKAAARLAAVLPARHRRFLEGLAPSHTEGDYFFVHAGVRPGVALDEQDPHDLLWIRDEFLDSAADHGKVVVHGHSICPLPEVRSNRIGIDTGAFASGRLTCVILDGDRLEFIQTRDDS